MRSFRMTAVAAIASLAITTPLVSSQAAAPASVGQAPTGESPILTNAKVKPKLMPAPGRAVVVVTSSEVGMLYGAVLLKQDGRWNRTSLEREWPIAQGRSERTFLTREQQSLLVEGKYRLRLRAVDDDGDKSARVVVEFEVDLRH